MNAENCIHSTFPVDGITSLYYTILCFYVTTLYHSLFGSRIIALQRWVGFCHVTCAGLLPSLRTRTCSCRSPWRGKCLVKHSVPLKTSAWKQHTSFLLVFRWPKPAMWSHTSSRGRGFAGTQRYLLDSTHE